MIRLLVLLALLLQVASAAVIVVAPASSPPASSDWATRSTAAGVTLATRFDTQAEVDDYVLQDAKAGNVSWQTAIKASGTGALRFEVLNADSANSGNWRRALQSSQAVWGNGTTFYVQYRYYVPEAMWRYKPDSANGFKASIISHLLSSNQDNEIVVQNSLYRAFYQVYYQDGTTFVNADEARSTPCNAANFSLQNAVDAGAPASPSTCAEYANRYGPIYDYATGIDAPTVNDVTTQGHPRSEATGAGVEIPSAEFVTVLQKVRVGTLGTASSDVDVWIARAGGEYVKIIALRNIVLGTANGGYNALWLLPYDTNKVANTKGVDTFVVYDEVIVSTNFIKAPNSTQPEYFASAKEKTWIELTTQLADVDPCPSNTCAYSQAEGQDGVTNDWTGAAASPDSLIIAAQGGHAGYAGNELYELDLTAASPAWVRLIDPSTSVQTNVAYYADGKPTSRHGYKHDVFIPSGITNGNRYFSPIVFSSYGSGSASFAKPMSWQRGTGAYDAQGTFTDFPGNVDFQLTAAWDSASELIWVKEPNNASSGGLYSFNPATNTWSARFGSWVLAQGNTSGAIDPVRRIFANITGSTLFALDLATPANSPVTITTTGTGPATTPTGQGLIYDPVSAKFIAWNGGATIYTLTPGANWKTDTWTWAAVTNHAANTVTPTAANANGTYGRFNYISSLRALVVVNSTIQSAYVYKLPEGAL